MIKRKKSGNVLSLGDNVGGKARSNKSRSHCV